MPTLAVVGAGPGLGLSIAKRFGREGFTVALVSRTQTKLDDLVSQLGDLGVDAFSFVADVMDRPSLVHAFDALRQRCGSVDVLEYSPAPHSPVPGLTFAHALELTVEDIQPQIEYYVYGAVTAVQQVLPDMLTRGNGTLLFSTGGSSAGVYPPFGNIGIAGAGLRNWVLNLNAALADKGVYAAHVPISTNIGPAGPESLPDTIAETYWELHTTRRQAERPYPSP